MMLKFFDRRLRLMMLAAGMAVIAAPGYAQPSLPEHEGALQHQSWSTEAGLPQTSVHQILQTRDGYLWLATEGGVVRYDGVSFRTFSHETDPAFSSSDVTSLTEDRGGNLWFGTADGLIEDTKGRLRRFGQVDGMPASSVLSLAATGDGGVLVLTSGGLVGYDGTHFKTVAGQAGSAQRLQQNDDGTAWLGTSEGLLQVKDYALQPVNLNASLQGSAAQGVERGGDGTTWLWSDDKVAAVAREGVAGRAAQHVWTIGRELPGARIQAVLVDRNGTAWIGTNRGLVTATAASQGVTPVTALGANSILSMMQDAEGNLWIGTETSGLHTLRPRKFREHPGLADEEVSCVVQASDGAMWIGTREDGLRRVRAGGKADRPVANSALTSAIILSLAPGLNGDVWAGTPDGLNHIELNGRTTRYTSSDGLPDDLVRSLLTARDGSVWAGTRRGLAHLQAGRFDTRTTADGLGGDLIGTIFEDDDRGLWIGTLSGLSLLHNGTLTNYSRADGLLGNLVTGLAQDQSRRLWVATRDAGLFLFDGRRFVAMAMKTIPREVLGLVADRQGFLWLRVRHGVARISTDALARCAVQSGCRLDVGAYGVEDGMPSEELVAIGAPSAWRTRADELWFATRKGVAITTPGQLPVNRVPPPVVLERFLADNDAVMPGDGELTIPSGHARYTFEYAGLSFTAPSKVVYRFQLEGFDRNWSEATTRRNASYTNLPPGTYTFRVQAANNDGVWNEAGAQVRFRILPPFYRRWWFLLLAACALVALSGLLYRLRVRRLQGRFDAVLGERSRIAREIHDTLAQDFVGVSLQLDLVSQMLAVNQLPEAASQLKATRGLVQAGLEEARQSIWNLRADYAHDSLPARVTTLVRQFPAGKLALRAKIGGAYRALPGALEDEVFRILQEAISNVQRHAGATAVTAELTYRQDNLVVRVRDNGRGFSVDEAATRSGHYGLRGMRERAEAMGAKLTFDSTPGEGTIVELVVPGTSLKGSQ